MSGLRLSGKRILITRAQRQASTLAEALAEEGAEGVQIPAIEFIPPESCDRLDSSLEDIGSYHWLIVTSANGAVALADRLQFLGIPKEKLHHLQVAAVGPATALALSQMGLTVSVMPEQYVAEAVVDRLKEHVAGKRILLARAAMARDVIPQELRKCGADIHVAEAYRTVIPAASVERVRELLGAAHPPPDAVTFTSSSTVNNFLTLLEASGVEPPRGLSAVSIGPITSQTLRLHHWEPAAEAAEHSIPGLVDACVRLLAPDGWLRTSGRC